MKTKRGITLIALIITVIVILILVGVSTNVVINGGIFNKTIEAVSKTKEQEDRERNMVEELLNKFPEESEEDICILNIEVKVPIYNATLGEFTVVFGIKGIEGENITYENVVASKISTTVPAPIRVELPVKEGTKVEVTALYSGGSYTMAENLKETILSKEEVKTVSFIDNYNYQLNKSSSAIVSL